MTLVKLINYIGCGRVLFVPLLRTRGDDTPPKTHPFLAADARVDFYVSRHKSPRRTGYYFIIIIATSKVAIGLTNNFFFQLQCELFDVNIIHTFGDDVCSRRRRNYYYSYCYNIVLNNRHCIVISYRRHCVIRAVCCCVTLR